MDVLIDLDDTLVISGRQVEKPEFFNICFSNYSMVLGGKEFLMVLQRIGARISFHSQGSRRRNTEIVSAIVERHFREYPLDYRLFSGDEESVRRKRLRGLFDGLDMERAIMLDDLSHLFAVEGEERNFLQILSPPSPEVEKQPDVRRHYEIVKSNALVRALGMIFWAVHLSTVTEWTLVEALTAMQWYGNNGYRHSQTHTKSIYELGMKAMKRVSPEFEMKLDGEIVPWNFDFDRHARKNNMFTPEQVQTLFSKLPKLDCQSEEMLVPPANSDLMQIISF